MEVMMIKGPNGALLPLDDDESEKTKRWKTGSVVRGEFKEMRNGRFFKKWWVLMQVAYDLWSDGVELQEHCGQPVMPEKNRFRKDVTVLAGYFVPVYSVDGSVTLEAESISWASMNEDRFERLYSACINVILSKVLSHKNISREQIDTAVEHVLRFA